MHNQAPMTASRTISALRLWALAWFMASLGVAIASPLVHSQSIEIVGSSTGAVQWLVETDEGMVEMGSMGMDCPLCVLSGAPPPATLELPAQTYALAHAVRPVEAARIAAATAIPPPARGPPALN